MFDRIAFPRAYERSGADAPGSIDEFEPLDASLRPIEWAKPGVFALGTHVRMRGWAVVPLPDGGYAPPSDVMLVIGDRLRLRATLGEHRDDVARLFGDARLVRAGFSGVHAIAGLPAGRYAVTVAALASDGRTYHSVTTNRTVEIVASSFQFPRVPERTNLSIFVRGIEALHAPSGQETNRFHRGDVLVARGDVRDRDAVSLVSRLFAVVDDREYFGGVPGLPSADGSCSDYVVYLPTKALKAGKHHLRILAVAADGASYSRGPRMRFFLRRA